MGSPEAELHFVGEYPLVSGIRYSYKTKRDLYDQLKTLYPDIPISYSTFTKRTRNIEEASRRTDLCETCRIMELLYDDLKKRGPSPTLTKEEKEFIQLWIAHDDEAHIQRAAMHFDRDNLTTNDVLILADFKENFRLAYTWNQIGKDWFKQQMVSCLTFVCYRKKSRVIEKYPVTFFSNILSHSSSYVLHCLHKLLDMDFMKDVKRIIWWSDRGPHFFSRLFIAGFVREVQKKPEMKEISFNYFCANHGKSDVDRIFGTFQQVLQMSLPYEGIYTLDEFLRFFREKTHYLESLQPAEATHYIFETFAYLFSSLLFTSSHPRITCLPERSTCFCSVLPNYRRPVKTIYLLLKT